MPGTSVKARIKFRLQGERWTRTFTVPQGTTILQLKEAMVLPQGTREDAQAFMLVRSGELLFDTDRLEDDLRAEFKFVSRMDPPRKMLADEARARKKGLEPDFETRATLTQVEVVVKHAKPELESQVTVSVPESATALSVRRAVLLELGERRLSEVKLVTRKGSDLVAVPDAELIGTRRAFLAMGRCLDKPAQARAPSRQAPQERTASGAVPPLVITKEQAVTLQKELLQKFRDDDFQKNLKEAGSNQVKRQAVLLAEQRLILPSYGFEDGMKGVFQMLQAMEPYTHLPEIIEGSLRINVLLGLTDPSALEALQAKPRSIEVVVEIDPGNPTNKLTVSAQPASTVAWVKERICDTDPTGSVKPDSFLLCSPQAPDHPLDDRTKVSEVGSRLRIWVPPPPMEEELSWSPADEYCWPPAEPSVEGFPQASPEPSLESPADSSWQWQPPPLPEPRAESPPEYPRESQLEAPAAPKADSPRIVQTFDFDVLDALDPVPEVPAEPDVEKHPASAAFDFDMLDTLDPKPDGSETGVAGAPAEPAQGVGDERVWAADRQEEGTAADDGTPFEEAVLASLTLRHATNGSSMTLEVPVDSTVLDVRKAAMRKLGETRLFNIKIVKRTKGSFVSESDDTLLGRRAELLTLGRALSDA